jgi:hypothetical protein
VREIRFVVRPRRRTAFVAQRGYVAGAVTRSRFIAVTRWCRPPMCKRNFSAPGSGRELLRSEHAIDAFFGFG